MLAVVYSLQKFDQYVYGREVTVESDHKPLAAIVTKPLRSAPKRLQGMLLKMQRYCVTIVYKPGTEMYLADTLSRAFLQSSKNAQGEFERINAVKLLPITDERLAELKKNTRDDEVLQQLRQVIQIGWPEERKELPACLIPYFSCRDELAIYDGLVFKGERLIVPKAMRASMKERLHSSHIGVNGCLRRARECLFWPGMTSEIKEFISQCESCCMYDNKQQRETLMSHETTELPWEKVGIDLFTIDGKNYLIVTWIPDVVISDNGPQFYCEEFAAFTKSWGFEHRTGSPGHQQPNGKAEASVKQAKKLIPKAKSSREDLYLGLFAVRNTPTESMGSSLAQRLLGRRCKTRLPTTRELLRPQTVSTELIKKQTKEQQQRQAKYYDRGARDLEPLDEGDVVRMRPFRLGKKEWDRATVRKRLDERSYEIETDCS
ncbi:uncharacterized protein K02A2.6-like [Nematostella vectensis]|uniref:uncharacterized protein K02A2.6-like n=1 Tax=Nematostella vectensis TaxID=45351 RepID=UPI002076F879|nr:uncharacterized protein K02A2.6-like [Nematostella vectensis]